LLCVLYHAHGFDPANFYFVEAEALQYDWEATHAVGMERCKRLLCGLIAEMPSHGGGLRDKIRARCSPDGHVETPAGSEQPPHFCQCGAFVGKVLQTLLAEAGSEAPGRKWDVVSGRQMPRKATLQRLREFSGSGDHVHVDVDTGYLERRPEPLGEHTTHYAGATCNVEHRVLRYLRQGANRGLGQRSEPGGNLLPLVGCYGPVHQVVSVVHVHGRDLNSALMAS
jgi:hypothetical protein